MKGLPTLLVLILLPLHVHGNDKLIPLDLLFDEPETYSYQLSPDSRYVAGYINLSGDKKLILIDTSTRQRYVLIDFKNLPRLFLYTYRWIDNDSLFLRYGDGDNPSRLGFVDFAFVDGLPVPSIRRTDASGILVDPLVGIEDTVLFAWEPRPGESSFKLYTVTVEQLEKMAFSAATPFRYSLPNAVRYRRDGASGLLLAATRKDDLIAHWYFDRPSRRWVSYFEHDPSEYQFVPVGRLSDTRFAVLTNRATDVTALVEFDIVRGTLGDVMYSHDRYDLVDAELAPGIGSVKSVSYVDHGRTVKEYFTDFDAHISRLLQKAFAGKQAQVVDEADSGSWKVLYVSASDDPGSYYLLDARTGEAELLSSRYPSLEAYPLARSEVFSVTGSGGEEIEAILTQSTNPNGVLLVHPHGGPIGVRDYAGYNAEVQFFANRGYAVLNVNFRGSSGFGKRFLDTGRGEFGKGIEEDISAVVADVLEKHAFESLCAIGGSYGGYSAAMLAIAQPDLYRCVVSTFGVFDLPLLFNAGNYALRKDYRAPLEAVVGEYSDSLKDVSPFYLAEALHAPVLLLAGMEDPIADYEQTNRMKYRLKQLARPVEHYYYPETGHGHRRYRDERHQFALIDDFIRRKLALAPPAAANADEVLADEYALIAEFYEAASDIEEHEALAASYARRAESPGTTRAPGSGAQQEPAVSVPAASADDGLP